MDYTYTMPQADRTRIGIIGHSLGGKMALYASALDERIQVSVEHEPCGFLGDAEGAGNLARIHDSASYPSRSHHTDAVLGAGNDPYNGKPLVQSKRGILKDGSNIHGCSPLARWSRLSVYGR